MNEAVKNKVKAIKQDEKERINTEFEKGHINILRRKKLSYKR